LQFTGTAGAESPGSQNVLVYNVAATAKSFQASVAADPGLNLVILPSSATLNPQQPTSIVVQPFTNTLAAGVYNGTITLEFSDGRVATLRRNPRSRHRRTELVSPPPAPPRIEFLLPRLPPECDNSTCREPFQKSKSI
jgi:hypothetical protein